MDKNTGASPSRKEILPAFIGTIVGACLLYGAMTAALPLFASNAILPGFGDFLVGCMEGSSFHKVYWFFADLTETTFLASMPATIGLVIGGFVAAHLERTKSPLAGTGVDGNGKIFTKMFFSSAVSLILGILFFGNVWPGFNGWIPTFAALLVVQPLIIHFGTSVPKLITCIIAGTFTTFPVAYYLIHLVVTPLGVPLFVGVSAAVAIVVPILAAILRALPWMAPNPAPVEGEANAAEAGASTDEPAIPSPTTFFINRVLGDVGELSIFGSSIATALMYVGAIIAWMLNPLEPAYGAGNMPLLIASQICCAALSIFIYYPNWKSKPFEFTFAGVVCTSAVVGGIAATGTSADLVIAILTVLMSAIVFVPIVNKVVELFKYRGTYPIIALIQLGIFPVVTAWALLINHVIVPMLL